MKRRTPVVAEGADVGMPPELAAGPCIEEWGGSAFAALRAWQHAIDEWATTSGWAGSGRLACNARNLARTRHLWSRPFLLAHGHAGLVAYFEGRRKTRPTNAGTVWPRYE